MLVGGAVGVGVGAGLGVTVGVGVGATVGVGPMGRGDGEALLQSATATEATTASKRIHRSLLRARTGSLIRSIPSVRQVHDPHARRIRDGQSLRRLV
jgi:hypothetical protein